MGTAARLDLLRDVGLRVAVRQRRANRRHQKSLGEEAELVAMQMWREAAEEVGAEVNVVTETLLELRLGPSRAYVSRQTTPLADPISSELADDKALAYRIFSDLGLPVPRRSLVNASNPIDAAAFAREVGPPVLVKPARGFGGAGIVGHIYTDAQLGRALRQAGRISREVFVEQQAKGDSYRLLVLDGETIGVLRRGPPTVTGDGTSTIADLLYREEQRRLASHGPGRLKALAIDLDTVFTLAHSGFRPASVLPAGESVVFKTATNYNGPGQTQTLRPPYPEPLTDAARQAAAAVGARLAGVDIVTGDPTRPLEDVGGVVLEVNARPALSHHYNVADAAGTTPIAVPILRKLLDAHTTEAQR